MGSGSYRGTYGREWMRSVRQTTGDELIERGIKLSLWERFARWCRKVFL